jgi:hypothetical protein
MEVSGQFYAPAALFTGKQSRYPLCRRLVKPQSRAGRCEEEKSFLSLPGVEGLLGRPIHNLTAIQTELSRPHLDFIVRRLPAFQNFLLPPFSDPYPLPF